MPGQRKGDAENPQDSVGNSPAASEESGLSSQLYSQDNFKLYSQDFVSVLTSVPGVKHGPAGYSNLTPWVKTFFFVHTYYVYIYVFYMFVLAFYKGYALEYPQALQSREILLIMTIPALQHLRFFFGHWGCELGMPADLCAFLALCSMTMFALMYFLFYQAYIMPLDTTFLSVAVAAVGIEGLCGIINSLQTMKVMSLSTLQYIILLIGILAVLATGVVFIVKEMLPREDWVEQYRYVRDAVHAIRVAAEKGAFQK
mmetsp:Transcript_47439/g.85406  ORF Transcript_47439/g.85406 Transcript_47439/m.85406 type:complete len:256 (+) Transcript_47439:204-971(+)